MALKDTHLLNEITVIKKKTSHVQETDTLSTETNIKFKCKSFFLKA